MPVFLERDVWDEWLHSAKLDDPTAMVSMIATTTKAHLVSWTVTNVRTTDPSRSTHDRHRGMHRQARIPGHREGQTWRYLVGLVGGGGGGVPRTPTNRPPRGGGRAQGGGDAPKK